MKDVEANKIWEWAKRWYLDLSVEALEELSEILHSEMVETKNK